ncbi:MAG: hypothetical protein WAN65_02850 [Candidatus Sulfotelmatobacter sp.]
MDRAKLREAVSLAGSIASITGVSLLWLKDIVPQARLVLALPFYLVASLIAMGVVAVAYLLCNVGYKFLIVGYAIPPIEPSLAGKLAYAGLVGGLMLLLTGTALVYIYFIAYSLAQDLGQAVVVH